MSKDRIDAKYIETKDAIHSIMPYLIEKRSEAEVNQSLELDMTKLKKWVDKQNKTLDYKMTYFHALTAVFAKTVFNRPLLNRFVQGHRTYERNDVSFAFVAKDKMSDHAEEKMIVLRVNPKDNGIELSRKMAIDIFKTKSTGTNDLDKSLKVLTSLPRWLLRIVAKIIKWLDYHGWMPVAFTKNDSNYATVLLSNLGSIKCDSCYHHLNDYGTNSIVITIGTIENKDGKELVDISATLDERIADGFYFAKSIKLAQHIMDNPKLLEEELSSKIDFEL